MLGKKSSIYFNDVDDCKLKYLIFLKNYKISIFKSQLFKFSSFNPLNTKASSNQINHFKMGQTLDNLMKQPKNGFNINIQKHHLDLIAHYELLLLSEQLDINHLESQFLKRSFH